MHTKAENPFVIEAVCPDLILEQLQPAAAPDSRLSLYQKSIHSLPMPPALWDAFQRACSKGASSHQLGEIIKDDPVLSAAILGSANSAIFGLRTPINNIDRAISHLGSSMVRSIVARQAFSSAFQTGGKVYNIHSLWKHGMAVSALAEIIAPHIPGCQQEDAGTLGLFHDVGRMAFNLITEYIRPAELNAANGHLVYEHARFGCTHIDMGIILAKHWQLPEKIIQGIQYHHYPAHADVESIPEGVRAEVLAVFLADTLAIQLGFAGGHTGIATPHASFAAMLPETTLSEIMNDKKVGAELARIQAIEF